MEIIDQTRQVLLKDKPFMTLTEAARYTGVGQHKQQQLGTTFVRAIREYKGLSTDEREDWNRI